MKGWALAIYVFAGITSASICYRVVDKAGAHLPPSTYVKAAAAWPILGVLVTWQNFTEGRDK